MNAIVVFTAQTAINNLSFTCFLIEIIMTNLGITLTIIFAAAKHDTGFSEQFEKQFLPTDSGNGLVHVLSDWAYRILEFFGLQHNPQLAVALYSIIVLALAIGIGILCRWLLLTLMHIILSRVKSAFVEGIVHSHFLIRLTALVPPLAYLVFLHLTYLQSAGLTNILSKLTIIYVVFVSARAASSFVNVAWTYFDNRQNKRKLPLKGIAQLVTGIIYLIGAIIVMGIIVDKSPATLLAGLGAFAAVLMLVFKDSILGVVAGVQLSEEDALHVGDWIKVKGTDANGTVIEANLSSVKVLNWDNTTTFLPPYSLINGSFTNYRSMIQSETRRIDRCYMIDADSIRYLDTDTLNSYRSIPFMDKWITAKLAQHTPGILSAPENLAPGSTETNLGLFRAYMKMYLEAHPDLDHKQAYMVSTQQQTEYGIPLNIYCFSATAVWEKYLAIQADIFEHVAITLQKFGLCAFESSSGRDTIAEGYLSAGHSTTDLFAAPKPFYNDNDTQKSS